MFGKEKKIQIKEKIIEKILQLQKSVVNCGDLLSSFLSQVKSTKYAIFTTTSN